MSINTYTRGSKVRVSVSFVDASDVAADPSTVTLTVLAPKAVGGTPPGEQHSYAYGDGVIVKDGVGEYHADITTDANGLWRWRWEGTGGNADAATEGSFIVASNVVKP